jgi:peptidoglycan/LPS O-acetylase OafA/YrhL
MVVIYHLYPSALPGGFAGVDVFFVISGYLITGHLWRGYAQTGKVGLADFWGRRARRLVPAAALVLTVTWIAARHRARDPARQHGAAGPGKRAVLPELAALVGCRQLL